ncbi:hypothetical protein VNO80_29807 [Phaseolus coccineus]|uniref:Uncharacterized protein n=1 Tax=Phaseolus coccineus TaxID=3886 RepID=A0AAN9QF85_PHACN
MERFANLDNFVHVYHDDVLVVRFFSSSYSSTSSSVSRILSGSSSLECDSLEEVTSPPSSSSSSSVDHHQLVVVADPLSDMYSIFQQVPIKINISLRNDEFDKEILLQLSNVPKNVPISKISDDDFSEDFVDNSLYCGGYCNHQDSGKDYDDGKSYRIRFRCLVPLIGFLPYAARSSFVEAQSYPMASAILDHASSVPPNQWSSMTPSSDWPSLEEANNLPELGFFGQKGVFWDRFREFNDSGKGKQVGVGSSGLSSKETTVSGLIEEIMNQKHVNKETEKGEVGPMLPSKEGNQTNNAFLSSFKFSNSTFVQLSGRRTFRSSSFRSVQSRFNSRRFHVTTSSLSITLLKPQSPRAPSLVALTLSLHS